MSKELTVNIKTSHLFKVLSIANKIGFTKELKVLITGQNMKGMSKEDAEALQIDMSADIIIVLLENLDKVEDEVYELLSDITSVAIDDIKEQSIVDTISMLRAVFGSEEIMSFFGQPAA